MDFREQVKQEIKDFSKEQQVSFTWRCAVRALPFLGADGNFDFWESEKRQKYLFAVLHAIDYAAYADASAGASASDASDAAAAISDTHYGVYVSYAAAFASYVALFADNANINAVAKTISDTVANAVANAVAAAKIRNIDLEPEIYNDIKAIQNNKAPQITTEVYGQVWKNFIEALHKNDSVYWATWYTKLFENNFQFDLEEVKQRINIPDSIKEQGAAKVGLYLEELKFKGGQRLNEARILILGDKGAGKTCVAKKLIDPKAAMTTPEESTPGVDTSTWKLAKENMNVSIWDFAGHTVTHAVHQFFLSERCLYILVYNGRTEDTSRLEYWLDHMKNYGGDSEAIILVNERDKHHNEIPINRLKEQYAIREVYYLNVEKDKRKFKTFRDEVANYIVTNPSWKNQEIPKSYYAVKEELEKCFSKNKDGKAQEQITKEAFDVIAQKHEIEDPEHLLEGLHALGVSLWYKGMEQYHTLILNPEWISDGVYQIINWVHNQKMHEIALEDFKKVFAKKEDKKRYPKAQHDFLFDLILNYELAYETEKGKKLIIPHLLKEDQPANLPTFEIGDSLMLKYKADQALPPHTISRFIVKHSDQIQKQGNDYLVWRYGVILEDGKGNIALVREWERAIDVSVKGPTKTDYISELRETLNGIFDGYKSKRPELQYNVTPFGDESHLKAHSQLPERFGKPKENWLAEQLILSYKERGLNHYDPISNQNISIKAILEQFGIAHNQTINFINNPQTVNTGDHANTQINTFNFKDCNISLQGNLHDLARRLTKSGDTEEAEDLIEAAEILETIEKEKDPEVVKKKGLINDVKRIVEDLGDKDSKLHKRVAGVRKGIGIAQDIAAEYNKVAQWLALPQVPTPFLKKE